MDRNLCRRNITSLCCHQWKGSGFVLSTSSKQQRLLNANGHLVLLHWWTHKTHSGHQSFCWLSIDDFRRAYIILLLHHTHKHIRHRCMHTQIIHKIQQPQALLSLRRRRNLNVVCCWCFLIPSPSSPSTTDNSFWMLLFHRKWIENKKTKENDKQY